MEAAQRAVEDVVDRVQREAKKAASVLHPVVASLAALEETLAPDDALVLYSMDPRRALALVVSRNGARVVALPPTQEIDAAREALRADDPEGEVEKSSEALRRLIVDPLALGPEVRRVVVSPDGALAYVPFALLVPEREVVLVPSGTTYRLLREDAPLRGEGVLALGDPDYAARIDERALAVVRGGTRLVSLPGTRIEAREVGDPVLLGVDASEDGLRSALGRRARWRAVHLACHGLIDTKRPQFSSLALTPDAQDDGFLTTLEVFRARIPADLVVLSACETGRGKVVGSEGIVGLTRAFMFAGSPRVICSLWKVEDEATRALMVKFYELWNPKDGSKALPTAEALRRAQAFVRAQEKWKHPYYWAAWVLWGLPE
jgi:CHAT domain-containing protein